MITKDQLDIHLDRLGELLIDGDVESARLELQTLRHLINRMGVRTWPTTFADVDGVHSFVRALRSGPLHPIAPEPPPRTEPHPV